MANETSAQTKATEDAEYINSVKYDDWKGKISKLVGVMDDLQGKSINARRLRYTEIDIEAERTAGKLAPDELYISQHLIDSNIRKEQSSYIQYITQSPRAVVMQDVENPSLETSIIERDLTNKIRYEGWQQPQFRTIDGFQQNGYSIMELVQDPTKEGELALEDIALGDFGYVYDTKDIQASELLSRRYYFTKTRLLALCDDAKWGFSKEQVELIIGKDNTGTADGTTSATKDKSLYQIEKVMFRKEGIVQVAWSCEKSCDNWIRVPRPLVIGRIKQYTLLERIRNRSAKSFGSNFEKMYPYYVFPYLITENNTLDQQKGRVYLDQDTQQGVSSLMSSYVTAHRRAAGLYFAKDTNDPNDDVLMQKNIYFKTGCLINAKVTQFQLTPPSADMLSAIQGLVTANMSETSQVNFAVNNRKDSRKTAAEVNQSAGQQQQLSTVQVVLFSTALRQVYQTMFDIIKSRVMVGLIVVTPQLTQLYQRKYIIKPAGDTDVIERQQKINAMIQAWPVIAKTPAAQAYLIKLLSIMFPDDAPGYIATFQQAEQQQQSAQAQQMQQGMQAFQQMASGIVELSKHKDYFSDKGQLHALPVIEQTASSIEQMMEQQKLAQQQQSKQ